MMSRRFIFMQLMLLLLICPLNAASFDLPVEEYKLGNGLTVLLSPDSQATTVSVFTFVNAGSRDEDRPGITGLAHVFEHMMFRGTERFPNFSAVTAPLGAESNAWTTNDYTAYFLNAEAQFLEKMLDIESDRFRNLIFTNETFRTELGPVKEERRKSVDDSPDGFVGIELERLAYNIHTYHHPVIGWEEDLETNMTFADGLQFKNRHYVPNNCVLVVTGKFNPVEAKPWIDKYYSGWQPGEAYTSLVLPEPPQTEERIKSFTWKDDETPPLLLLAYHVPAASDLETMAALNIINQILFSQSGTLTNKLKKELALVESVDGQAEMRKDPGLESISARMRRGASMDQVRDSIYAELSRMGSVPISAEDLSRACNNLRAQFVYRLDRPSRIASSLGVNHILAGSYQSMIKMYDLYATVDAEKIRSVAAEIFTPQNRTVVTLLPKSSSQGVVQ